MVSNSVRALAREMVKRKLCPSGPGSAVDLVRKGLVTVDSVVVSEDSDFTVNDAAVIAVAPEETP